MDTHVKIFVQKINVEFSNVPIQERMTTRLGQRMTLYGVIIAGSIWLEERKSERIENWWNDGKVEG